VSRRLDKKLRHVYAVSDADMRYMRPSTNVRHALALLDRIARVCNLQWNVSAYTKGNRLQYDGGWGMEDACVSSRSLALALARLANDPRVIGAFQAVMKRR